MKLRYCCAIVGLNSNAVNLIDFFAEPRVAGVVGALGLLATLIGFVVTIKQVTLTKSAAEAARSAVRDVQERLDRFDVTSECTSAIQALREIERLHRLKLHLLLPDRYNDVRKALVMINAVNSAAVIEYRTQLQDAITQLATLRERGERILTDDSQTFDVVKSNRIVSKIVDSLLELSVKLRSETIEVAGNE